MKVRDLKKVIGISDSFSPVYVIINDSPIRVSYTSDEEERIRDMEVYRLRPDTYAPGFREIRIFVDSAPFEEAFDLNGEPYARLKKGGTKR